MSYDTRFRPQIGHWNQHLVIYQDGTLHVAGRNAELMDESELMVSRQDLNQLALSTSMPRLQWWSHRTRLGSQRVPPLAPCKTWWARSFDEAVASSTTGGELYRNDLFFTLYVRPRPDIAAALAAAWRTMRGMATGAPRLPMPGATAAFVEEVETLAEKTLAGLRQYGARQLGCRRENGVWFSEVWEAHHAIGNGFFRPIPLCNGTDRAGRQIVPARVVFRHRDYEILADTPDGLERHSAILAFANYPGQTHPLMYEPLMEVKHEFTITNCLSFKQTQKAIDQLDFKQKQLGATKDSPRQAKQVNEGMLDLQDNLTAYGKHHFLLRVGGRNREMVNRAVWACEPIVSRNGATLTRLDKKTMKGGFYAQFPGLARYAPRRGSIPAMNFAGFAPLSNVPSGTQRSRWGGPLFYLRTTRNTLVPYHLHVTGDPNIPKEDVASWLTVGGMGSGKTSHNGRKAVAGQRLGARSIIFDKDCGLAPTILANDGEYLLFEDGRESGASPLRGLTDTPEDISFLQSWMIGLIESDGFGGINSSEDAALGQQIAFQMSLPPELRSIDGIWPLLGSIENGAGPRLRKWGRTGRLGWAFDGEKDRINIYAGMLGFDTTALLRNALVCQPMLLYLFHRIESIIYQRKPLIIMLDECWQTIGKKETTGTAIDNTRFVGMFNDKSKTIRKNEGAIGLITQNAFDLLNSEMKHSIQQNMPTKEFFGDRQARAEDLIDGFNLTAREFHIIKNVLPTRRHALLVKRPDASFIAVNDLSAVADKVTVLSGRRSTYDLLLALREKFGDRSEQWVPHYERLAPRVVDDPHQDIHDLIEGRAYGNAKELVA
jgi:type IV secretion system protein VirB4